MFDKLVIGISTRDKEKFLKEYKNKFTKPSCEIILEIVENREGISLSKVYNSIWKKYQDKENCIFLFMHDDLKFKINGWGKCILKIFENNDVDILGIAGTERLFPHGVWWLDENLKFSGKFLYGKVWHLHGNKEIPSNYTGDKKFKGIKYVQCIDGLFIAFNPKTCDMFDEDFDGFHFYDISFSFNNYLKGRKVAVTEAIQVCHVSHGVTDEKWEKERIKFINKIMKGK